MTKRTQHDSNERLINSIKEGLKAYTASNDQDQMAESDET